MVCINNDEMQYKFYTDDKGNFIEVSPENKESVLLYDVSNEYDGVCTFDGNFHFLIQSIQGELIYLKFENKVWKKYSIFKNKDNECKIKNIRLTFSDNLICAFYTIEHLGKFMLTKHIFSANNLYTTPEIADLTNSRQDFCICTDDRGYTHLFYQDALGKRQKVLYDKNFSKFSHSQRASGGEIYNLCVVNSGERLDSVYMSVKKNYTALMYCGEDERKEKIITFGITKNTLPAIYSKGDNITIIWKENRNIMKAESKDGGESFSKPRLIGKRAELLRRRRCGIKAGMFWSDLSLEKESLEADKNIAKRRNVMPNRYDTEFLDLHTKDFVVRLDKIQAEIEKLGLGLERVCAFLDRLTEFKKDTEKDNNYTSDIGEKNEENIKLFENMSIDEALPENKEIQIAFEE